MNYCPLCERTYGDEVGVCEIDGASLRSMGMRQDPYLGKLIKGRYNVISKIGEGGMGSVYLAEQISIGRKVALKVLQGNYASDDEFIGRFRREARLAASLNHRNIVTVYDFDQSNDGSLFIAMEYLRGTKLSDVIRRDGPLEIQRAVSLGVQIAEGLEAAHLAGVIHRDIKPDNIMVIGNRGIEECKLMDFGIARMRDAGNSSNLTRTGMIMGTPAYMAPEQAEGADVSEKTDIYALGVVLYEMLSGSVPFKASTPGAVLIKHLQEQPAPLRKIRRELPSEIERLVMQALEKKPEKRLRDMRAVVEGLQKASAIEVDEESTKTMSETRILTTEGVTNRSNLKRPIIGASIAGGVLAVIFVSLWFMGFIGNRSPVVKKVESLVLQGRQELLVGEKDLLKVNGNYGDGTQSSINEGLEWQSSNAAVVTVSRQGEVEALKEGVAGISAKHQSITSPSLTVRVKAKPRPAPVGPTIDDYIMAAWTARDKGDYDAALDSLRKAKAIDPKNKMAQSEYQQTRTACLAEKRAALTTSRCGG